MIAVWTILDDSEHQDGNQILSELFLLLTREIPDLPGFLSEPLEAALRGTDPTGESLSSVH